MRTHLHSAMLNNVYPLPADSASHEFGSTASGGGGAFLIESDGYGLGGLVMPSPPANYSPGSAAVSMFDRQLNGNALSVVVDPYFQYEVMIHDVSPLFSSLSEQYGNIDVWVPLTQPLRINGYYYSGTGGASFKYSMRQGIDAKVVTEKTLWIDAL